jgi:hypothetical protein
MISFRYHLVSLVALFLALAGGIALGAGPLQEPVRGELTSASGGDDAEALRSQLEDEQRLSDFQARYGAGTADLVLGDRLAGMSVAVVLLPGADPSVAAQLAEDVQTAGGELASRVTLTDELLDPGAREFPESLARRVLDGVAGVDTAEGATGYELIGGALGRALLTRSSGQVRPDDPATSIVAAFEEANLVGVDGADGADGALRRAQLALLVTGDPPADTPAGQGDVVAELATGLDRAATGSVVVGSTGSTADGGAVAGVRASPAAERVSTVDAVETATGRLVGVLALVEQAAGGTGQYGADGADGALPDLSR